MVCSIFSLGNFHKVRTLDSSVGGKVESVPTRIKCLILFHGRRIYLEYGRKRVKWAEFS